MKEDSCHGSCMNVLAISFALFDSEPACKPVTSVSDVQPKGESLPTSVLGTDVLAEEVDALANAGHHAHPLLLRDGQVEPLVAKGMPLGMMAGISYREIEFPLASSDVLVFMTDGIIEAKDSYGVEYQDTS